MENEAEQKLRAEIRKELRTEVEREVKDNRKKVLETRTRNGGILAVVAFLLFSIALAAWMVANPVPALIFNAIALVTVIAGGICALGAWVYFDSPGLY